MTRNLLKNISDNVLNCIKKGQGILTLAFFLALSSCSGDPKYREDTTETLKKNVQEIETDSATVEQARALPVEEVQIKAIGNTPGDMAYDQQEITVNSGTMVKITLNNEADNLDMLHNIVFTTKGHSEIVARAGARIGAPGNFIPDTALVVAASPIAKPGQTVKFEFKAPPPGEYEFICTYPDHYLRMKGKMTVK